VENGWLDHQAQRVVINSRTFSWQLVISDIPRVETQANIV